MPESMSADNTLTLLHIIYTPIIMYCTAYVVQLTDGAIAFAERRQVGRMKPGVRTYIN